MSFPSLPTERSRTMERESYVERWKREQAEKAQKPQNARKGRKKVKDDGRSNKAQGQTEGQ